MLRARHRRRPSTVLLAEERPRIWIRLGLGVVIVGVVWYLGTALFGLFDGPATDRTAVMLTLESGDNVRVSLQGAEEVRAQDGLKLYEGDSVSTQYGGNVTLTFFDGTRVRLDEGSTLRISENTYVPEGTSSLQLVLASGQAWVETGTSDAFTGAIVRVADIGAASVRLPGDTSGLLGGELVFFVRTSGIGAELTLNVEGAEGETVIVGEGQSFSLSPESRTEIAAGRDPYAFRDPITTEQGNAAFVVASRTAFASAGSVEPIGGEAGGIQLGGDLLVITAPENNLATREETVRVAGRVSARVSAVAVNDYPVTIEEDGSFSEELTLPEGDSVLLRIQAQDEAGITLAEATRTVERVRDPVGAVTIVTPGASGATVNVAGEEVEITGRAPARAAGIVVNDYRLQLFKPGDATWSYLASTQLGNMKQGENVYRIHAVDATGTAGPSVSITLVTPGGPAVGTGAVLTPPPSNNPPATPGILSVRAPSEGTEHTTSEVEILIEGRTSTATDSIWVNDYRLQLYEAGKDFWNYIASVELGTMKPGRNVYRVVARDAQGQVLDTMEYVINYQPE